VTQPSALVTRLDGPSPEAEIARDMARRGLWVAPVAIAVAGLFGGTDAMVSTAVALAVVLTNFGLAAASTTITARISLVLMMGAALFGYLIRLGLVVLVFLAVRNASWFHAAAFGTTIIVAHLGLLFWEVRHISATLAYPGLKPTSTRRSTNP
jgi:hypothetical protein